MSIAKDQIKQILDSQPDNSSYDEILKEIMTSKTEQNWDNATWAGRRRTMIKDIKINSTRTPTGT